MSHPRPINTLVHCFEFADSSGAMYMLQSEKLIDIKVWIGNADICSINIFDLFNARIPIEDTQIPEDLYEKLYSTIYLFDTMFSRHYFLDGVISVSARLNIFNVLARYLYSVVKKNSIELMLFSNIPHEGPDFLLYEIARHLNIKTIIFTQTLFPNMFFLFRTIEDFGVFSTSITCNSMAMQDTIDSLKPFEKPLFYMKGAAPLSLIKRTAMITPHKLFATIWNVVRKARPQQVSVGNSRPATDRRGPVEVVPSLVERAFNLFFTLLIRSTAVYDFYKFSTRLNRLISHNLDLSTNYIYFPLHLQPELTTAPLGYEYNDQALALEELHSLLPAGWKIFVKENPKQTEFMRDPFFFKRVEALSNLVWVPRDYDTHTLIRSCKILATVTGTAGWEALVHRKPVIVFGNAWYKHFPHVFSFYRDMDLLSVASAAIDMNNIYKHLNALQNKMGLGVVDPAYYVLVDNYSDESNCDHLFESIKRYIDDKQ